VFQGVGARYVAARALFAGQTARPDTSSSVGREFALDFPADTLLDSHLVLGSG